MQSKKAARFLFAVGLAASAVVWAANPAGAVGAPVPKATISLTPDLGAGAQVHLPDGTTQLLPKDWASMTVGDLAKIGIVPGMGPSGTTAALRSSYFKAPISAAVVPPPSAYGCNVNVCIDVRGSGLIVQSWQTFGYNYAYDPFCTFSVYWAPSNYVFATGTEVCGGLGEYYSYEVNAPLWFPNNTKICNTWVQIAGKPCETVHS